MGVVQQRIPWDTERAEDPSELVSREWLVTNGLGGYAAGTVAGAMTRRFHGLLIAALPGPLGRVMMLNHLAEIVRLPDGGSVQLGGVELAGGKLEIPGAGYLAEFVLEEGLPVWRYRLDGFTLEKRLLMPHMQNTVHVTYRLARGDGRLRLKVRPAVHFRPHEGPVSAQLGGPYVLTAVEDRYEVTKAGGPVLGVRPSGEPSDSHLPPLRMMLPGERSAFTIDGHRTPALFYRVEQSRGYESVGELWSPGYFRVDLAPGRDATLIASTESWETIRALPPREAVKAERERRRRLLLGAAPAARSGPSAELVFAADQFIVTPAGRMEEAARARAAGDECRTVIAGYHWFTDWGRDTMISLEGLTLVTGRHAEAGYILRTFGHYVRDGLIPNLFPEGERQGLYHTADASLWYFHALDRYLRATDDRETLRLLLPTLRDMVRHHLRGTRFNIGVDPADGLLRQGAEGYQLTWMDAKVGDWVVTPRRGKAVEINGLWYNALRLLEGWCREEGDGDAARELAAHADRAYAAFNRRFWYDKGGYLYDVVDTEKGGDDPSLRPNQILALSLRHPVLDERRWRPVVETVREHLLTPVGLRSLAPGSPDFKSRYDGDLRARDAAYHQGTVWAWLIGPFVDAWLQVYPDQRDTALGFLRGFDLQLTDACVGTISEIFDAEPPYAPRGCVAQAWSVAEVLRSRVKLGGEPSEAKPD
jgi:predicted glycogen debranching enzyme